MARALERRKQRHVGLTDTDWEKLGMVRDYINKDLDPKTFQPITITDLIESYVRVGLINQGIPPPTAKEVVDRDARKRDALGSVVRDKGKVQEVGGYHD